MSDQSARHPAPFKVGTTLYSRPTCAIKLCYFSFEECSGTYWHSPPPAPWLGLELRWQRVPS